MRSELDSALKAGKTIIFVDEAVFTVSTILKGGFAPKGKNIAISERTVSAKPLAVVAGVSKENGLDAVRVVPRSIDSDSFIDFLNDLLDRHQHGNFAVFLDNCRVHHSIKVRDFCKRMDLTLIFNVPYTPEFNPIERVWAMIKASFKKEKMKFLQQERKPNYDQLIHACMQKAERAKI